MSKIDRNKLGESKARVKLSELIGHKVNLTRNGVEFLARCPFHNEDTPSFTVNDSKGFYYCFGCGETGDHITWLTNHEKMSFPEAAKYLSGISGTDLTPSENYTRPETGRSAQLDNSYYGWTIISPVPDDTPAPSADNRWVLWNAKRNEETTINAPQHVAAYRDAGGLLRGYVVRFLTDDGKKITPQVVYAEREGERRWIMGPMPIPRTFYHADDLPKHPDANVIVFVGEKKTDEAAAVLSGFVCLSWCSGDQSYRHTDFSVLSGRKVIFWPDNDDSGREAVLGKVKKGNAIDGAAKMALLAGATAVKVVGSPEGVEKGWDVGDGIKSGWGRKEIIAHIMATAKTVTIESLDTDLQSEIVEEIVVDDHADPAPEQNYEPDYEPDGGAPSPNFINTNDPNYPFQFLGYNRSDFFFITNRGGQVICLTVSNLSSLNHLMLLAPTSWWESNFMSAKSKTFGSKDLMSIANFLIGKSYERGIYEPANIRGRGVWVDDGRCTIHLGDKVMMDGVQYPICAVRSQYVYEKAPAMTNHNAEPLTNKEASEFLNLCKMASWEKPLHGYVLAGWSVIAPICGMLDWRPSIWVSGPSGSGKGWIMKNIVRKAIGKWGVAISGKNSAYGIRMTLGSDARPILFDESEAEGQSGQSRMQDILFMNRAAASSSDDEIQAMGESGGKVSHRRTVTMMALSSVNISLKSIADEGRFTILTIRKTGDEVMFANIKKKSREVMTDDFSHRLFARTISLSKTILKNAAVFTDVLATMFRSRRAGDQLGIILAGAYSLVSDKEISHEDALIWIKKQECDEVIGSASTGDSNETRLLQHILESRTKVDNGNRMVDVTMAELIDIARGVTPEDEASISIKMASKELGRWGMRVNLNAPILYVATSHSSMQKLLKDTDWSGKYGKALEAVPGAVRVKTMHIGVGAGSRTYSVVAVPITTANVQPEPAPAVDEVELPFN